MAGIERFRPFFLGLMLVAKSPTGFSDNDMHNARRVMALERDAQHMISLAGFARIAIPVRPIGRAHSPEAIVGESLALVIHVKRCIILSASALLDFQRQDVHKSAHRLRCKR